VYTRVGIAVQISEAVVLVARTEGLLTGGTVSPAIDKLVALAEAGADCL
jgi:2-methylisocitrate lyase-like PEP mutase family enzyme